jgi:ABC-type Zn uptake system ZnuABC Zn-binding protein ZnuA
MAFDPGELAKKMFEAFEGSLTEKWPEVKDYAEAEAKKIAESLVMIEKLILSEQINEEQAKIHFQIQHNATRMVLLTVEGLGIIAVEQAINAALDVLKDTVNTALDFTLL